MLSSCKSLGSAGGIAVFIKSGLDGRAPLLHFSIRLAICCILHQNSQSSWCSVNLDFIEGNTIFFKLCTGQFFQLFNHTGHNVGRHFFRSDF